MTKRIIRKLSDNASIVSTAQLIMLPTITIKGQNQILIEQQYQLITFTEIEIKLKFKEGYAIITGINFAIKMMYANEIIIEGEIKQIIFQKEEEI